MTLKFLDKVFYKQLDKKFSTGIKKKTKPFT